MAYRVRTSSDRIKRALAAALLAAGLAACSEGGSSPAPPPVSTPPPAPPPPPAAVSTVFETEASTARFLTRATFGPRESDLTALTGGEAAEWFIAELNKPPTFLSPFVTSELAATRAIDEFPDFRRINAAGQAFYRNAVAADDQLRQRMAFALSQLFVVSDRDSRLGDFPEAIAYFQDRLIAGAFGNFRTLLEDVTFSPAMAVYLTYLQNEPGDPTTGRLPDENYAREIMQLFTIGLVRLNPDGTAELGADGEPIETYTNEDISGLARVFTGLSTDTGSFPDDLADGVNGFTRPLATYPAFHSSLEKSFLGTTIPAGTGPDASIDAALDALFNHPNVAPFISRQLIQRFVTSAPSPAYVARVAAVFEAGAFTLPDGETVGAGARGDLSATLAAILFDETALDAASLADDTFGKVREPVVRFATWARAFDAGTVTPEFTFHLWDASSPDALGQHPYRSPSVFNFYRPGYVAPGTVSGAAGLTAPELQIVNANSTAGYANFLTFFALQFQETLEETDFYTANQARNSFRPDYSAELALAGDPAALVARLDRLLTYGSLSDGVRAGIVDALTNVPLQIGDPDFDGARLRVQLGVTLVMTSPDFLVQR
ncbi:MAG: DUF1800 family protein [Pseudomonadota bacterium]